MNISQILDQIGRDVITVRSGASLKKVSDLLTEYDASAAVVLTDKGNICGIVSERDLVRNISGGDLKSMSDSVVCSMTLDVVCSDGKESTDEAMTKMSEKHLKHLPVLENGELSGLVSIDDLVKHKVESAERDTEELKRYIAG